MRNLIVSSPLVAFLRTELSRPRTWIVAWLVIWPWL
jgi:hypothetical protein